MATKRGKAAIIITVFTVMAVLLAAGGVTTVLLVKRAHHKHDVKEANKAAATFDKKAESWKDDTVEALRDTGASDSGGDYKEVKDVVKKQTDKAPSPPSAPSYGKEHSSAYKNAKKQASKLTDGLDDVTKAAKLANEQSKWASKAYSTLLMDPGSGLPTSLKSSKKIRKKALPKLKKELKKFRKLDTPDGADKASKSVEGALKYAIKKFKALAKHIDDRKNYSIHYRKKYSGALDKVEKFRDSIGSEVKDAIDDFDGTLSTDDA